MGNSTKISKSILTVGFEKISMILIQLITSVVLARLLTPSDYGTIAMISIFISLSSALVEAGLGGSLVYYKDVDDKDYSTVFWLNIISSIVLYLIIFSISSTVSEFYGHPELSRVLKISGLSIVFSAVGTIQLMIMYKKLLFKKLAYISIASYVVSAIIAIVLAYRGLGVWALVAQQVLISVIRSFLLFFFNRFVPSLFFSKTLVLKHWNFGKGLLFSTILKTVYDNMYLQLIGKYCSIINAGYYNQAKKIKDIPTNLFSNVFETALFPIFSKYSDESLMISKASKVTSFFAMVICPIFVLCVLLSDEIVLLLLGNRWLSCSWIFSCMSIGAVFFIFEAINRSILKASGYSNLIFKIDVIKRTVNLLIMLIAIINFEIIGIVFSFVVNCILGWLINTIALSGRTSYSFKKQVLDLMYYYIIAAGSGIVAYYIPQLIMVSNIYIRTICIVMCMTITYSLWLFVIRDRSFNILASIIRKHINNF